MALLPQPVTFAEVYAEQMEFVWRCAVHRGVPMAAVEDVVQEVFIIVHRKLPEFEGRSSVRTWIGGIARRVIADFRKKRGNRPAGDEPLTLEPPAPPEGPDAAEQQAALSLLDSLLERMPDDQREVFVLREIEGLSGGEIAAVTETNENTVWTRLRAARRIFQDGVRRARAKEGWEAS